MTKIIKKKRSSALKILKNHENHENYRCVPQIASPEERKIQNTLRRFRMSAGPASKNLGSLA